MLGSREDAEDVLQEVFAAAFNAVLADEREINVRPWLYRIARNRSLNHLRRASAIGVDSMDVHFAEHGISTGDKVMRRESFRELIADVQQLPETQRTALLLREIDALSYEQIAHAMETTVPSVKSLLVRARISLAEAAEARKLSCEEVRLELGEVAEGLVKLSTPARRHVRGCERCRSFKKQLKDNNHALAAILPVGPLLLFKKLLLAKLGSTASPAAPTSPAAPAPPSAPTAGAGAAAARRRRASPAASSPPAPARSPPRPSPASPPPRSSPPAPSPPTTPAPSTATITPHAALAAASAVAHYAASPSSCAEQRCSRVSAGSGAAHHRVAARRAPRHARRKAAKHAPAAAAVAPRRHAAPTAPAAPHAAAAPAKPAEAQPTVQVTEVTTETTELPAAATSRRPQHADARPEHRRTATAASPPTARTGEETSAAARRSPTPAKHRRRRPPKRAPPARADDRRRRTASPPVGRAGVAPAEPEPAGAPPRAQARRARLLAERERLQRPQQHARRGDFQRRGDLRVGRRRRQHRDRPRLRARRARSGSSSTSRPYICCLRPWPCRATW